MTIWIYRATPTRATESSTVRLALEGHVICRPARKTNGHLIPNVGRLRVGDVILLAYTGGGARGIHVAARVGSTLGSPVPGTVIDRILDPAAVAELQNAHVPLPPAENGRFVAHVIRLEDVVVCKAPLQGTYGGNNAIHVADSADAAAARRCVGEAAISPDERVEPPPRRRAAVARTSRPLRPVRAAAEIPGLPAGRRPLFDRYVMIDWSASAAPRPRGKDAIWLASGRWSQDGHLEEDEAQHAPTRREAVDTLHEILEADPQERVLVGFDFAFGYPAGFAAAADLGGGRGRAWKRTMTWMGVHVHDDRQGRPNRHDRDAVAATLNGRVGDGGPGPFWGCPHGGQSPDLTSHRVGVFGFPYEGLCEWRHTEMRARGVTTTQSVWKLDCGVSVGGQTILGLHWLHKLLAAQEGRARIWPLQTGWTVDGDPGRIVLAEIFPSLLPQDPTVVATFRDEEQVITCVRHAARLDARGRLDNCFARPGALSREEEVDVLGEEGWILFLPQG